MPIEGPLRELDIHDVFQLLDLSRKTGALRVTSGLRDNEGTVYFDAGQVVYASVRSNPHPLGAMLVRSGRLSEQELARARARQLEARDGRRLGEVLIDEGLIAPRELERQLRLQIEAVVFELLSWREGFFSFVEQDVAGLPADATVRISAESLLMEAARRIDEWSTIADRVPDLSVVPALVAEDDGDAGPLTLDGEAWEVLAAVDGLRDLRAIAAALGRSEFDVAMVAARLVQARVIRVGRPEVPHGDGSHAGPAQAERSAALLAAGDVEGALAEARLGIAADPHCAAGHVAAARALHRLGRAQESLEELRRAAQLDAASAELQRELGYAAARAGDLAEAVTSWKRYLHLVPAGPERDETAAALDAASRLRAALEAHAAV
ncbi:MAG TPA: DUF4388 domain-containing protein [Gemmatimonadaceae bacterium]|nr:DUF4388 domain-containing protein [Gemmatimonadaceae bacterium]